MRFMVITKATPESEAGILPATEDFDTMGAFIEELVDAGVLLAAEGLHQRPRRPDLRGRRRHDGRGRSVHRARS